MDKSTGILPLAWMFLLVVLLVLMVAAAVGKVATQHEYAQARLNESAAHLEMSRGQSQAVVIGAEGDLAIDRATADSIRQESNDQSRLTTLTVISGFISQTTATVSHFISLAIPFVFLFLIFMAILIALAVVSILYFVHASRQPVQVVYRIENRAGYLPTRIPRRELWNTIVQLESGRKSHEDR